MKLGPRDAQSGGDGGRRLGGLLFDQLIELHWDSVYKLSYHLCGNVHDAHDLAQETFLKAIDRRDSFKEGTNLRAWLMRIASNAFLDDRRKRKTARAASLESVSPLAEPSVNDPATAQGSETMSLIEKAIATLDDQPRLIFLLRTQEELSFREIAEIAQTTEETARWYMLQARRHLMKKLEGKV